MFLSNLCCLLLLFASNRLIVLLYDNEYDNDILSSYKNTIPELSSIASSFGEFLRINLFDNTGEVDELLNKDDADDIELWLSITN
jgi:hypothetical protein